MKKPKIGMNVIFYSSSEKKNYAALITDILSDDVIHLSCVVKGNVVTRKSIPNYNSLDLSTFPSGLACDYWLFPDFGLVREIIKNVSMKLQILREEFESAIIAVSDLKTVFDGIENIEGVTTQAPSQGEIKMKVFERKIVNMALTFFEGHNEDSVEKNMKPFLSCMFRLWNTQACRFDREEMGAEILKELSHKAMAIALQGRCLVITCYCGQEIKITLPVSGEEPFKVFCRKCDNIFRIIDIDGCGQYSVEQCIPETTYLKTKGPDQKKRAIKRRHSVIWFSQIMEKVLRKNDHKTGWEQMRFDVLLARMRQEIDELLYKHFQYKIDSIEEKPLDNDLRREFINECADIANYAMMIAKNMNNRYLFDSTKPEPE